MKYLFRNFNFKGQSAIEFVIIVMAILFLFVGLLYFIQGKISDSQQEAVTVGIKEVALTIQNEINLARSSADGYSRQFRIPLNINGHDYEANILEDSVYVRTNDGKHAVALPVGNVTGDIFIGTNSVYKLEGIVYLN